MAIPTVATHTQMRRLEMAAICHPASENTEAPRGRVFIKKIYLVHPANAAYPKIFNELLLAFL